MKAESTQWKCDLCVECVRVSLKDRYSNGDDKERRHRHQISPEIYLPPIPAWNIKNVRRKCRRAVETILVHSNGEERRSSRDTKLEWLPL
ncbi:hypothetical protein EVAR_4247_1 [Eumeta japonica]|uniref:Uncharacterized protein n=1 Tax=Eumeta variegata TaxID=151549 RepID=A0A4C1TG81_EUMVA|nr:hypothetical protein EVAR_4247_1 [Eumeta japonica]